MKLSIITINKNNVLGLEKTIQSVIGQTYKDFEYIVIDGNSNDGSVDIIKQYADKITYWVSEPDKGIYNAMNKGILQTSGEYCLFLNSGDWLVNDNILSKVFSENLQEDIIYGNIYLIDENEAKTACNFPDKWTFRTFLRTTIPHPAAFIKKQLFSDISLYDETLNIISDWVFFVIAVVINNKSYIHLPYCISNFKIGGVSRDIDECYMERAAFLSKSPYIQLISQTLFELQKEIDIILNSNDYRLGRKILNPLRKIKRIFYSITKIKRK
jgi:glycosyltransferase involved in cell wall biosynthesis